MLPPTMSFVTQVTLWLRPPLDGVKHANPRSSRFFQDRSGNVQILRGSPFPAPGIHELKFDATHSGDNNNRGFLGVLTLTMTIRVVDGGSSAWELAVAGRGCSACGGGGGGRGEGP